MYRNRGKKGMKDTLLKKLQSEKRFFLLRKENILDQIETKKIEVLEMEYKLETLQKDLARSEAIIDLLKDNGF